MPRPASLLSVVAFAATALLAGSATAQPKRDPAALFARTDLNHDGVVTRAEFQTSRIARFRELDRNHDGYLSLDDVPHLGALSPGTPRLQQMLGLFDTDHDGRVSLAEFIAGSMRLFDQADANHDGVLTRVELAAAIDTLKRQNPAPQATP